MDVKLREKISQTYDRKKLVGIQSYTEDEYSQMIDELTQLYDEGEKKFSLNYKLVFATLVEIAKRWKGNNEDGNIEDDEKSGYWKFVGKIIVGDSNDYQKIRSYCVDTIRNMVAKHKCIVNYGRKYYATIMMHSFAPKSSICSFFDLCYNVFKNDLEYDFTEGDDYICQIITENIVSKLGQKGFDENKQVSIGSKAYFIKIGLRSFALHEDLHDEFKAFVKDTLKNINKLFNREKIEKESWIEILVNEWWNNKINTEGVVEKRHRSRIATVTKQNVSVKYIVRDNVAKLCIPPIRLEENDCNANCIINFGDGNTSHRQHQLIIKRGEFVTSTKQLEINLDDIPDLSKLNVEITIDDKIIFDSDNHKSTSLNREFIIFDGEKEIISKINKPNNYLLYSKNVDALKSKPDQLFTVSQHLFSIYPKNGESISGVIGQVMFVDSKMMEKSYCKPMLFGCVDDIEWRLDDIQCNVYKDAVKLLLPGQSNLKSYELRIDDKNFKIANIEHVILENGSIMFELLKLGIVKTGEPTKIVLYSYDKECEIINETIIVLPRLSIKFSKPFYYNDDERKVTIINGEEENSFSWDIGDEELVVPYSDGEIVVKIPNLKWKINDGEWNYRVISNLWYKAAFRASDVLTIDLPIIECDVVMCPASLKDSADLINVEKNAQSKYEIGREIYGNCNKFDSLVVWAKAENNYYPLFMTLLNEKFSVNPLVYSNDEVIWRPESTYIGDSDSEFMIEAVARFDTKHSVSYPATTKNDKLHFECDVYDVVIRLKSKNFFSKNPYDKVVYKQVLTVGKEEEYKFAGKSLKLTQLYADKRAYYFGNKNPSRTSYIIRDIRYVRDDDENFHYEGNLYSLVNNRLELLEKLPDENGNEDDVNPIIFEIRSNRSLQMYNDYFGSFFIDTTTGLLCNINSKNDRYKYIVMYKYEIINSDNTCSTQQ